MKKRYFSSIVIISGIFLLALQACKKESSLGIDNDRVIRTPYSLYAVSEEGAIITTTDGENFYDVFPPDGYPGHSILTAGPNILLLKENLHLSENNGKNFNPVYSNIRKYPWQSMAYHFDGFNRTYMTGIFGRGIVYSMDNGKSWYVDTTWEENVPAGVEISSFAGIANSTLYCYSIQGSLLFKKNNADDNWEAVVAEDKEGYPDGADFYLSSSDNTLFLIDYSGQEGVWYSEDGGLRWKKITQGDLPSNIPLNCAISPSSGFSLLVGTDSMGVYTVEEGRFVNASGGIKQHTSIYRIATKTNTYKNDLIKPYVFIGTSDGIYRSENRGKTWHKVTYGILDQKYTAIY